MIEVLKDLSKSAKSGDIDRFVNAPKYTFRSRVDETAAARNPILRWYPKEDIN